MLDYVLFGCRKIEHVYNAESRITGTKAFADRQPNQLSMIVRRDREVRLLDECGTSEIQTVEFHLRMRAYAWHRTIHFDTFPNYSHD